MIMALEQQIQKDIMEAMKAKDTVRLNSVRSIKSAILLAKTAEGDYRGGRREQAVGYGQGDGCRHEAARGPRRGPRHLDHCEEASGVALRACHSLSVKSHLSPDKMPLKRSLSGKTPLSPDKTTLKRNLSGKTRVFPDKFVLDASAAGQIIGFALILLLERVDRIGVRGLERLRDDRDE